MLTFRLVGSKVRITMLRHMRRAIARARLYKRLKRQRRAKKSTPCLIKKASRCAADRTSKTTLFVFHFYITQRSYEKIMCIYLLFDWFSGENCIISTLFLHKGRQTQVKKKHEWCNNRFSDVFTYCLNLKHFASLFFLTKDNFMF